MTHPTQAGPKTSAAAGQPIINLPDAAVELLELARSSRAGRAGQTVTAGAGAALKQTLMALTTGESLADHDTPTAATLQVLIGSVRLTGGGEPHPELHAGDLAPIPPVRHGLTALDDAVVLISVGQGAPSETGE